MGKMKKKNVINVAIPNEKAKKLINIPFGKYIISEDGFIILSNGEVTPIKADKNYFRIETIEQEFEVNNYVIFTDKQNKRKVMRILEFNYRDKLYKIVNVNNTNDVTFSTQEKLTKSHLYYFINSRGRICNAYWGYDKEADEWRINSVNYFSSNEEATKAKADIIAKSERNRC